MTAQLSIVLTAILRQHALHQSDRPIDVNQPLGATGLGLDSLALLQFITAVENHFEIELPESIWTEKGELTIERFTSLVITQRPELAHAPVERQIAEIADSPPPRQDAREHQFYDTPRASIPIRIMRKIRHEERFYILRRELEDVAIPRHTAMIPLNIEIATPAEIERVGEIFPSTERGAKMEVYRRRVLKEAVALLAFTNGDVVGIDWVSGQGEFEPHLNLQVSMAEGSCIGFDLNEHPAFRGKGVGMALLSHSLEYAKQQGYRRQFTIVHSDNTKMLSASVQIFGFDVAGEIVTTRNFSQTSSIWKMGDSTGSDRLTL